MSEKSFNGEQRYAIEKGKRISEEEIYSRLGVHEYLQIYGRQRYKPKKPKIKEIIIKFY